MPNIFISHSSKDKALSYNLAKELNDQGYDCFLDFQSIPGGAHWEQEIYTAIRKSIVVLVCATTEAMNSHWVIAEIVIARYSGIPVIPLIMENCSLPINLKTTHYIDFTNDPEKGYRLLIEAIARINHTIGFPSWPAGKSPYPGLVPFRDEHAPVFFGRELELESAIAVLRPGGNQQRFLTFVGPSGCGKSSLLRAGLIPALKRGTIENSENWIYLPAFTPGETPFRNLAEKIRSQNQSLGTVQDIETRLRKREGLLYNLLDIREGKDINIVLVIDQLEEIERRTPRNEAIEFLSQISETLNSPDTPLIVLATLRADFFSACLQFPGLTNILQNNIQILGAMDRPALRRAIIGPAQVAGLIFEDGLVEEILDDTQGGDALPLLAHTLQLLWDGITHFDVRKINRKMYINVGRVQDALALRAEQIYKEIPETEQFVLRKAFIELADVNESGSFTRRRIRLSSLSEIAQKLLERFVQARLLVTSQYDEGIPYIEVAHEAIFRVWPLLSQWLEKESERIKLRRDIELASLEWEAHNQSQAYLWRVERLEDAINLMEAESWDENDRRRQFLVAAQRLAQKERYEIQHLSALRAIGQAQNAEFELEVVLQVILDVVITELNVDAVTIFLLDPSTQDLIWTASRGFIDRSVIGQLIKIDENSLVGQAAVRKQLIVMQKEYQGFQTQYAVPLIVKGHLEGVLQVFHLVRSEVSPEWLEFLVSLGSQAAVAIVNARLFQGLQKTNLALEMAYEDTILAWQKALALRDRETEGHTERVTELTLKLASAMGIDQEELAHIRRGAILHDIGKMGIPDGILQKPGPLTEMEWSITRRHPEISFQLLAYIPYLRPALDIPYCHHERWDGSGYPRGLKGESIPLAARIFSVVDVWDSLISDRPYRKSWPYEKALNYIKEQAGISFDPQVVDEFIKLFESQNT